MTRRCYEGGRSQLNEFLIITLYKLNDYRNDWFNLLQILSEAPLMKVKSLTIDRYVSQDGNVHALLRPDTELCGSWRQYLCEPLPLGRG